MEKNNLFLEIEQKLTEISKDESINEKCIFHKTQIKVLINKITELYKQLVIANEKAEESELLKSAFLQSITHEVRTPMNAIVGFSQLLTKSLQSPEKIKRYADIINENSNKLLELMTDFLEISQINAHLITTKNIEFDIINLISELYNDFKIRADFKNLQFTLHIDGEYNEYLILSDKTKLEKTLKCLIGNAIKFTEKGFVKFDCNFSHDLLKVTVTDSGIGISQEIQEKIFEPFRQVDTGISRCYGGTGLGLSIAKSYVEHLKGQITIKSEINKGTELTIQIPVKRLNIKHDFINNKYNTNISNKTILIVDDEQPNYEYLFDLLTDTNATILHAINGLQALDICRDNQKIELVLMDIKMPVMNGHTATRLIKLFRPEIRIIAQTAFVQETDKEQFLENGFDDYLTKPFTSENLFATINKYL